MTDLRTNFDGGFPSCKAAANGGTKSMPAVTCGVLCLTFDDSHFDDWEEVLPLFAKYNARATFFAYHEIDEKTVASLRRP